MDRIVGWFRLEGDTPRERLTRNPIRLAALVGVLWVATVLAYAVFSTFMGGWMATIVILVGAIAVGVHLRRRLVLDVVADPDEQVGR